MVKTDRVGIDVYNTSFLVIRYDSNKNLKRWLRRNFKKINLPSVKYFNALACSIENDYLIMFKTTQEESIKYPTPGIVAHEAKHLVNYIFKDRFVELDLENDEPEAYLLGFIVDKIHALL